MMTSKALPFPTPRSHAPFVSDSGPARQFVIVHRESAAASGEDEHPGADQLIANMSPSGLAYQAPVVIPAASASMSLRPSAIWRSSSIASSRLRRSAAYRIAVP